MMKKISLFALICFFGMTAIAQKTIKAEKLKEHVFYLAGDELEGRGLATESGMIAAEYIAAYFKSVGLKPIGDEYLHPFKVRVGQSMLNGNNVVGMVEGSDPALKDEYLVLGAHFDHISYRIKDGEKVVYNGADDNASGTAAVMEIGRILAQNKGKLKRSVVLVAFDGEESGLLGSGKFVTQEIVPLDQIKAMMSIDMIGRYAESGSLVMGAMEDLKIGKERLMLHADEHKIKIKKTGGETSMRTDTKPFGDVGIPAIYVSSGIVGPYHKPEDDPETLDYDGMELITNMLVDLTVDLSQAELLAPASRSVAQNKTKGMPFLRFGAITHLGGSAHVYPNEFYKANSRFSADVGFMAQIKLTNNLALQPEFLYSTMASAYQGGNFRTHSASVPVNLVLATSMDPSMQQRFYLTVGGYYSYHFAGRLAKKALDFESKFSPTDMGIQYGIGAEVMSVFISLNFKHGLTSIATTNSMKHHLSRGAYFTVGYMF